MVQANPQLRFFLHKYAFIFIAFGIGLIAILTLVVNDPAVSPTRIAWQDIVTDLFIFIVAMAWIIIARRMNSDSRTFIYFFLGCANIIWLTAINFFSEWHTSLPTYINLLENILLVSGLLLLTVGFLSWSNQYQELRNKFNENTIRFPILNETDSLTGLNNRPQFDTIMVTLAEDQQEFSLLLVDLDHFKSINDTYGRTVGDTVIEQTARIIRRQIREGDLAFRLGGEEFALVLLDCPIQRVEQSAQSILQAIKNNQFFTNDGESFSITTSIGISHSTQHDSPSTIYRRTDSALYKAKSTGRNQIVTYSTE